MHDDTKAINPAIMNTINLDKLHNRKQLLKAINNPTFVAAH